MEEESLRIRTAAAPVLSLAEPNVTHLQALKYAISTCSAIHECVPLLCDAGVIGALLRQLGAVSDDDGEARQRLDILIELFALVTGL